MRFSRLIDWLGSARRINTDINDEMGTLKFEREILLKATKHWREKHDLASLNLTGTRIALTKAQAELVEAKPLIAYALKRKASLAKHDKKRGRG